MDFLLGVDDIFFEEFLRDLFYSAGRVLVEIGDGVSLQSLPFHFLQIVAGMMTNVTLYHEIGQTLVLEVSRRMNERTNE